MSSILLLVPHTRDGRPCSSCLWWELRSRIADRVCSPRTLLSSSISGVENDACMSIEPLVETPNPAVHLHNLEGSPCSFYSLGGVKNGRPHWGFVGRPECPWMLTIGRFRAAFNNRPSPLCSMPFDARFIITLFILFISRNALWVPSFLTAA